MRTETIVYPSPSAQPLWKTNIPKRDRLMIINEEDLPVEEFLTALGVKESPLTPSFGITDEAELQERHALCSFLTSNPTFMTWVKEHQLEAELPTNEDRFLRFYDPKQAHNPYWQAVHQWLETMQHTINVPARLQAITDKLIAGLHLEAIESDMASAITQRVEQITIMSGLMSFQVSMREVPQPAKVAGAVEGAQETKKSLFRVNELEYLSGEVHGHRKYSQQLSTELAYPTWTENMLNPLNWLGLGRLRKLWIDPSSFLRRRRAYRAMVIKSVSKSMKEDVKTATENHLNELRWDNDDLGGGTVTVLFAYDQYGLKITVLNMEAAEPENIEPADFNDGFEGYDGEKKRQMVMAETLVKDAKAKTLRAKTNNALIALAQAQLDSFFWPIKAFSSSMDRHYRWFAISNEYRGKEFNDIYQALEAQRQFFAAYYLQLRTVIDLLESVQATAHKFGVPICQPEIVTNGHVVDFGQLYPTQLLCRLKKGEVTPIHSLPELNGRMIVLTGHHGGGKSETQISIVANIYLAQSGLPVFGEFFRFNVKKVLGMVFIAQRGQGSTCEMLLGKIRNILKGIKGVDGKQVVLVLDEVGTGTQEMAGLELGRDLLHTLALSGVSVIFSTQIISLAEFARDKLNALCFQMDSEHQVTEGIGDGGMQQLRQRTGVEKLLTHVN
ncbi:MAG: hypothetical protein UR94_C0032G0002 [Parcubacteria group bacterium GW2011_GWA2_36_10]|nr:MAG: hypothetical protein UR94_C0032G0002 [Parcubacteria group bacterium GW2011_GWA2_36_10]